MTSPVSEPKTSIIGLGVIDSSDAHYDRNQQEYLHFAAAHFTLFSATERENLHGHNFQVTLNATAPVHDDGLTFDYNILKKTLKALCDEYDEQVLMPTKSPYLSIENDNEFTYVLFNGERIPFLTAI